MIVSCMLCIRKFDVNQGDPQYQKLLTKETKYYICKLCNSEVKTEARHASGIDPDSLDPDRYDKLIP
jgi:uncharacterized protein YlaI